MPNIHFRQGPVNELNNETCKKNNKNMVPSFIGLHGNFFMKFTKWLKMFSSSSFLQLFLIRKNRLQAAPALAMAKVKLYGSQARDTKLMKAISFWYKDIRLVGDADSFSNIFCIWMYHESYYFYVWIFDICKYHDDMIIHYCVKVIYFVWLRDTSILESHMNSFFLQNNLRKTPLDVRPWNLRIWVFLSGRLHGPKAPKKIHVYLYISVYIQIICSKGILSGVPQPASGWLGYVNAVCFVFFKPYVIPQNLRNNSYGKSTIWRCISYWKRWISIAMLVYWRVL